MDNTKRKLTTEEKKDAELVKKIKPKLRKFVIEEQRQKAQEVAKEKTKEEQFMLNSDDVIRRASELAAKSLLKTRIWQKIPPYLPWRWTTTLATTPELESERNGDITGFATYLVREYRNYLKLKGNYRNPMVETNIEWFWQKFNADLKLLIEAEMLRVKKGNTSVILGEKDANGKIVPIGKRIIN